MLADMTHTLVPIVHEIFAQNYDENGDGQVTLREESLGARVFDEGIDVTKDGVFDERDFQKLVNQPWTWPGAKNTSPPLVEGLAVPALARFATYASSKPALHQEAWSALNSALQIGTHDDELLQEALNFARQTSPRKSVSEGSTVETLAKSLVGPLKGVYESLNGLLMTGKIRDEEFLKGIDGTPDILRDDNMSVPVRAVDSLPRHVRRLFRKDPIDYYPKFRQNPLGGPNCYHAALYFHEPHKEQSYIRQTQLIQALDAKYRLVEEPSQGDIVVKWGYSPRARSWYPEHSVVYLTGPYIFHKRDQTKYSRYDVSTLARAFSVYDASVNTALFPKDSKRYSGLGRVDRYTIHRKL